MALGKGTNFGVAVNAYVTAYFTDSSGNAIFVTCSTSPQIPSSVAGYAVGCLLLDGTDGTLYKNAGSATSCTFSAV